MANIEVQPGFNPDYLRLSGKGTEEQDELEDYLYSLRMVLEEIPFKVVEAAVRKVVLTNTFFPVPAEIFQAVLGFSLDKPPSAEV